MTYPQFPLMVNKKTTTRDNRGRKPVAEQWKNYGLDLNQNFGFNPHNTMRKENVPWNVLVNPRQTPRARTRVNIRSAICFS